MNLLIFKIKFYFYFVFFSQINSDFPISLQVPVCTITSALVEAIAAHRLSLLIDVNNTPSSLEKTPTTNNNKSRH